MRVGAVKHVIVVSNDDSDLSAIDFDTAFLALDASHEGYQFHSIVGSEAPSPVECAFDPENICCQDLIPLCAARGQNYIDLTALTGGAFNDLCLQDFAPFFEEMANSIIQSVPFIFHDSFEG